MSRILIFASACVALADSGARATRTAAPGTAAAGDDTSTSADGGGSPCSASDEPWVVVGTGSVEYEPLIEGQELPIVMGPQGGFHVWGGFHGCNFDPDNLEIAFVLRDSAGVAIAGASYIDDADPVRDGFEYSRVTVILQDIEPEDASGQTMTLELDVRTRDGLLLEDDIEIVPICCE